MSRAVRAGVGLREASWDLPDADDEAATGLTITAIVDWMRETAAGMRRPYGIDHVAVAFACRNPDGRVVCSNALGVVRPGLFYSEEGLRQVRNFIDEARSAGPGEGAKLIGALLCLGEVAQQLGIAKAA